MENESTPRYVANHPIAIPRLQSSNTTLPPPRKKQRRAPGIAFVHCGDASRPSDDPKLKRFIRSHVSRVQHCRNRGLEPYALTKARNSHASSEAETAFEWRPLEDLALREELHLRRPSNSHLETSPSPYYFPNAIPADRMPASSLRSDSVATRNGVAESAEEAHPIDKSLLGQRSSLAPRPGTPSIPKAPSHPTEGVYLFIYPLKLRARDCLVGLLPRQFRGLPWTNTNRIASKQCKSGLLGISTPIPTHPDKQYQTPWPPWHKRVQCFAPQIFSLAQQIFLTRPANYFPAQPS